MYGAVAAEPCDDHGVGVGQTMGRAGRFGVIALVATVAAALLITVQGPSELLASVQPGTQLELQTSNGPMLLTVDSPMTANGYVHATGWENNVEYQGYVRLTQETGQQQLASPYSATGYNGQQQQLASVPQSGYYTQPGYYGQPQTQQLATAPASVPEQQMGVRDTLDISRDGEVSINGERVVAANSRTAAMLRLLAKRARTQSLMQVPGEEGRERFSREIDRGTALVDKLERREGRDVRRRASSPSRKEMWAAMQSLMQDVDSIEQKQASMAKVVNRVKKIMRYTP